MKKFIVITSVLVLCLLSFMVSFGEEGDEVEGGFITPTMTEEEIEIGAANFLEKLNQSSLSEEAKNTLKEGLKPETMAYLNENEMWFLDLDDETRQWTEKLCSFGPELRGLNGAIWSFRPVQMAYDFPPTKVQEYVIGQIRVLSQLIETAPGVWEYKTVEQWQREQEEAQQHRRKLQQKWAEIQRQPEKIPEDLSVTLEDFRTHAPIRMFQLQTAPLNIPYLQKRNQSVEHGGEEMFGDYEYISIPANTRFTITPREGVSVSVGIEAIISRENGIYFYSSVPWGTVDVLTRKYEWVNGRSGDLSDGTRFTEPVVFTGLPLTVAYGTYDSYDDVIYRISISAKDEATGESEDYHDYWKIDQAPEDQPVVGHYTDVQKYHYYYYAVKWALERQMLNASDTLFKGEEDASRIEVITSIWKAMGSPKPSGSHPFTDIPPEDEANEAVSWAYANGFSRGTSDTTFDPDATCTRGQIVTFLWRLSQSKEEVWEGSPFTDVQEEDYFAQGVHWAVAQKLTTGTSPTTFSPNTNCTRAQILTFLWRGREVFGTEPSLSF